jgi:hypothetical protein
VSSKEAVNHPAHYGGADKPYEAIKVIEAWDLGFHLGNTVKYISRAGKKTPDLLKDLKKAAWYLNRHVANLEAAGVRGRKASIRGRVRRAS